MQKENERELKNKQIGIDIVDVDRFRRKKFLDNIFTDEHPLHKSIGFEIFKKSINGLISNEEATNLFKAETRHYAKRQITWFKNRSTDASFLKYEDVENFILKNF